MNAFFEKFVKIEREVSEKRGSFALFGLFLREDSPNLWDLVVSAPWFGLSKVKTINFMFQQMKSRLKSKDLLLVSRIVVVDTSDPRVKAIQDQFQVEHGAIELLASEFFDMAMSRAFIVTAKKFHPSTRTVSRPRAHGRVA